MYSKKKLWLLFLLLISSIILSPILSILTEAFESTNDNWEHLKETLLLEYIYNSLFLTLGVSLGSLLLGIPTAWLTAVCSFPFKKTIVLMLILPMSMPAYIIAYTYTGLLDFSGPVQSELRNFTGWDYGDYYFPEIRSIGGAVIMLSLVLYPYVYLLARATFLRQSTNVMEVSRLLNSGPWESFLKIALPLSRPAIIVGLSLVIMETLADYGTVSYFGVSVFTTGIFRTWFGLGDYSSASKMAALLLVFIFFLVLAERSSRKKDKYYNTVGPERRISGYKLNGIKLFIVFLTCLLPIIFGFIIPTIQLSIWAYMTLKNSLDFNFTELFFNSVSLSVIASIVSLITAFLITYCQKILPMQTVQIIIRLASIGYALPGTIIAVGVIVPLAFIDHKIDTFFNTYLNISTGLIFSGTVVAIQFAYLVRFLSISISTVESGLEKIRPNMDKTSQSLGVSSEKTFIRIHLPILKISVLTSILLVFVDVIKELPATLILRPFNFNTLAVKAYELASDERLADASIPALAIVLAGLLPLLLITNSINKIYLTQS